MSDGAGAFPQVRPVADHAVLVEFGEIIRDDIHARVLALDAAIAHAPFPGFIEAIPAFASLFVDFDPLVTDFETVRRLLDPMIAAATTFEAPSQVREVLVCYDEDFGPDLKGVAERTGKSVEEVIATHLSGDYGVYMYGFAPGYAYLAGVPADLRVPRKPAAIRNIAAGSVVIAGPMCLVTTLIMPTGWWIIGRSPTRILGEDESRPVLFDVGDRVRFKRISREEYDALGPV